MNGWDPGILPETAKYGPLHFIRFAVRWVLLALIVYGLFAVFLLVRLVEWPWGRPVTPSITRLACFGSLIIIGLKLRVLGRPFAGRGVIVANHVTWIDIFSFNAVQRIVFVAKSEVASWTGIGILARATGTVFVERNPRRALQQRDEFVMRLARGDKLLFFPEGTSTDGLRVLPFKPTLFAAFFAEELKDRLMVQPVTVRYRPRQEQDPAFYGFWGEMGLGESMFKVLSAPRNGNVDVVFHDPVSVADFAHRKDLAVYCEEKVREGLRAEF